MIKITKQLSSASVVFPVAGLLMLISQFFANIQLEEITLPLALHLENIAKDLHLLGSCLYMRISVVHMLLFFLSKTTQEKWLVTVTENDSKRAILLKLVSLWVGFSHSWLYWC